MEPMLWLRTCRASTDQKQTWCGPSRTLLSALRWESTEPPDRRSAAALGALFRSSLRPLRANHRQHPGDHQESRGNRHTPQAKAPRLGRYRSGDPWQHRAAKSAQSQHPPRIGRIARLREEPRQQKREDGRQRGAQNDHRDHVRRSYRCRKQDECGQDANHSSESNRPASILRSSSDDNPREARNPHQYSDEDAAAHAAPDAEVRSTYVVSHEAVVFSTPTWRNVTKENRAIKPTLPMPDPFCAARSGSGESSSCTQQDRAAIK